MMNLKECYEGVKALDPDLDIESFEIVEEVSRIRQYWRPETVRVVLLAESHVICEVCLLSRLRREQSSSVCSP